MKRRGGALEALGGPWAKDGGAEHGRAFHGGACIWGRRGGGAAGEGGPRLGAKRGCWRSSGFGGREVVEGYA